MAISIPLGSGFIGTENIMASVAGENIIPNPPSDWNIKYSLYKFSFINKQSCHVKINGSNPIYLEENQGFETNEVDCKVYSFVILEDDVQYLFIGAY